MIIKPCPFCGVENSEDTGGACCFCDYQGVVTIGPGGYFEKLESYQKIANADTHESKIENLIDKENKITEI